MHKTKTRIVQVSWKTKKMVTKQSFKTLILLCIFVFSASLCSIPALSYDLPDMPDMSHMPNIPYMPHMFMPDMSNLPAMPRMNMPGMPRTGSGAVRTRSTTVEITSKNEEISGESTTEEYEECWSHLSKIDNCVNDILSAYSFRKFDEIGSVCCSAVNTMTKDCHAKTLGSFHDHFFSTSVSKQCSII